LPPDQLPAMVARRDGEHRKARGYQEPEMLAQARPTIQALLAAGAVKGAAVPPPPTQTPFSARIGWSLDQVRQAMGSPIYSEQRGDGLIVSIYGPEKAESLDHL